MIDHAQKPLQPRTLTERTGRVQCGSFRTSTTGLCVHFFFLPPIKTCVSSTLYIYIEDLCVQNSSGNNKGWQADFVFPKRKRKVKKETAGKELEREMFGVVSHHSVISQEVNAELTGKGGVHTHTSKGGVDWFPLRCVVCWPFPLVALTVGKRVKLRKILLHSEQQWKAFSKWWTESLSLYGFGLVPRRQQRAHAATEHRALYRLPGLL